MYKKQEIRNNITSILVFILIFISIYNLNISYATIHFKLKVISSKTAQLGGQVYYSNSKVYPRNKMTSFILRNDKYGEFQEVNIAVKEKNLKYIRLDPLNNVGEVIIKNFSIIQGSWFNQKISTINLSHINTNQFRNIKILDKKPLLLHLQTLGSDPHLEITNNAPQLLDIIDYKKLFFISFVSLVIYMLFKYIVFGLLSKYFTFIDLTVAATLIIYSTYTLLFSTQHDFIDSILLGIPLLNIIGFIKYGFQPYLSYIKYAGLILLGLTLTTLSSHP